MIGERIEIGLGAGMRADAEWCPQIGGEQPRNHPVESTGFHHTAKEKVGRVRGRGASRALRPVQSQGKEPWILEPEVHVDAFSKMFRGVSCGGRVDRVALSLRQGGEGSVRSVRVSLDFDQRDGRRDTQMVVRTILPSLVEEARRVRPFVLQVAVVV